MIHFILLLFHFTYLLNCQIIVDYPLPIVSGSYSRSQTCTCEQIENLFFSHPWEISTCQHFCL